jgi:hypothetical protein
VSDPLAPRPANILSFRKRVTVVPGHDRLAQALAALDLALAEQRRAITEWRGSLAELGQATAGLARGLACYRTRLDMLETSVGDLNDGARRLNTWADEALARDPH